MTALPIPFVTAFLSVLLAASNHRQLHRTSSGRVFALFLYLSAVSMFCIGLRWSHELVLLILPAAFLSILSAAFLYLAFRSLGMQGPVISVSRDWLILVPAVFIPIVSAVHLPLLDPSLVCVKLIYSYLLLDLARKAPESLQQVRLNWLRYAQQAVWGSAFLLLFSALVDVAITIDFAFYEGAHAARIVGYANLVVVLLLGWIAVVAGQGKSVEQPISETKLSEKNSSDSILFDEDRSKADDEELLRRLNGLLLEDRLYADTELNLQKLARKAGVPARAVSHVVNKITNQNVSQWINQARIDAACELLKNKETSVTEAMLSAGFLTKSNFNREFRRLKGASPSEWRKTKLST